MVWGRLILLVVVVTGLVGAAGTARAAGAGTPAQSYDVLYTGSGDFGSVVQTLSSPACGSVTSRRTETTRFSWYTDYNLRVGFGSGAFTGATVWTQPQPLPSASNDAAVALSVSGCNSGIADCQGESQPAPGHPARLYLPSVVRRGRVTGFGVDAVAPFYGFTGTSFYGQWSPQLDAFSCDGEYNDASMVVPLFDPASVLHASLSVGLSMLKSLPRGHSMTFQTAPGHNAQPPPNQCQAADGCVSEHMTWQGQVKVTRKS